LTIFYLQSLDVLQKQGQRTLEWRDSDGRFRELSPSGRKEYHNFPGANGDVMEIFPETYADPLLRGRAKMTVPGGFLLFHSR
jgi:hypothetical protein